MIVGRVAENQHEEPKKDLSANSAALRDLDDVTGEIVDAAYKVHVGLGPGLLESVYEMVLTAQLTRRGLKVERQRPVSFEFDGMRFDEGFRVDLLVEDRVVVELKSVEALAGVHSKQLLTYLKLLNLEVGLLINFGAATLKDGIHRIVNNYTPPSRPLSHIETNTDQPHQTSPRLRGSA